MDIQTTEVGRIKGFLLAVTVLVIFQFWVKPELEASESQPEAEKKTAVAKPKKSAPAPAKAPKKKQPSAAAVLQPSDATTASSTAAAVWAADILPGDARSYLDFYAKTAQREMSRHGIPASITLAQALCESNAGLSDLALETNNHFGMKCFAPKHRGCCMKFRDDDNGDGFRRFANAKMSYDAHSKLLKNDRYAKCRKQGKNWRRWAQELQRAGYATDKRYAEKLISVVIEYQLWKYDGKGALTAAELGI